MHPYYYVQYVPISLKQDLARPRVNGPDFRKRAGDNTASDLSALRQGAFVPWTRIVYHTLWISLIAAPPASAATHYHLPSNPTAMEMRELTEKEKNWNS
ncbi:hypothetical protein ElyMa_006058100 [Elysia marginata]|uniref:Uncharacterized protein n=1 Tax=Elysia marginata TaxID=1093978 RepID=A0AAV4GLL9_9GAST|nr:hypothetical protein ElyMa_006058100 [Elysia marginata]